MELCGKALYNLLRGNWLEDPTLGVESWQVEDYRIPSDAEIFGRLEKLGILLDQERFLEFAGECDGPEELADLLFPHEDSEHVKEKGYLLLFELWRRKLPDRATLSVFCDELDHLIDSFDRRHLTDETKLETALEDLEKILDESVDAGLEPKEAFSLTSKFCAHDLESFIYDYISQLITESKELDASEWIDGFYDYIEDSSWFDFLRARLLAKVEPEESNDLIARMIESLADKPELDLGLEIATFLAHEGDPVLFRQIIIHCLEWIETEEDFQDLLAIVADYHRCLDEEGKEKSIEALFQKRSHLQLDLPFDRSDKDKTALIDLLT
jgi:hypothetical protein